MMRTFALAVALTMVIGSYFGYNILQLTFNEAVTFLQKNNYPINDQFSWQEFKAASIHITPKSVTGFIQHCKRLRADIGAITFCIDFEFRIICVYDPEKPPSERILDYFKWG